MASKMVLLDRERSVWMIGSCDYSREAVQDLIDAVPGPLETKRDEMVAIGSHALSVGYLSDMLAFADENGWFWDCWERRPVAADHEFDERRITPGNSWGYVEELKAEVAALNRRADEIDRAKQGRRSDLSRRYRGQAAGINVTVRAVVWHNPGYCNEARSFGSRH